MTFRYGSLYGDYNRNLLIPGAITLVLLMIFIIVNLIAANKVPSVKDFGTPSISAAVRKRVKKLY